MFSLLSAHHPNIKGTIIHPIDLNIPLFVVKKISLQKFHLKKAHLTHWIYDKSIGTALKKDKLLLL